MNSKSLRAASLLTATLGLCAFLFVFSNITSSMALWSHKPGSDINWQQLTDLGILLVGTDDAVSCYEAESGKVLWKRDFRKIAESQVVEFTARRLCWSAKTADGGKRKPS